MEEQHGTIDQVLADYDAGKLTRRGFLRSMLTRGGPGSSTETISLYIYKLAFNDFQLAYGAAAAFLVLLGSLVLVHLLLAPVRDQLLDGGR